jgi:hypothetical protein
MALSNLHRAGQPVDGEADLSSFRFPEAGAGVLAVPEHEIAGRGLAQDQMAPAHT